MTINEYFGDWSKVIDLEETKKIMHALSKSKAKICPLFQDIFKAFKICPLNDLKVVILGQDPYNNLHTVNTSKVPVATGLAFANSSDTPEDCYSTSLEILKESVIDYTMPHGLINFDPSLEKWEAQGVLLLNTALSCELGKPGSHSLLWRPFTRSLLRNLSMYHSGIAYVLMGSNALSFEPYIRKECNSVFRIRHPSWYARNEHRMPSEIWREVNSYVLKQTGTEIEWYTTY